jgi:hypothetical protein
VEGLLAEGAVDGSAVAGNISGNGFENIKVNSGAEIKGGY